jgi:hypothetical protein
MWENIEKRGEKPHKCWKIRHNLGKNLGKRWTNVGKNLKLREHVNTPSYLHHPPAALMLPFLGPIEESKVAGCALFWMWKPD